MKKKYLLIAFCIASLLCFANEQVPCEAYPDFHPRCYVKSYNYIVYYIFNSQEYMGPAADRVWIGNSQGEVLVDNIHAKQGEWIDISSLPRGYYICYVQLGDCIGSAVFYKRTNPDTDATNDIKYSSFSRKLIREGHVLIFRNGKYYSVTGQVTNCK